jgi:hypothetical protein
VSSPPDAKQRVFSPGRHGPPMEGSRHSKATSRRAACGYSARGFAKPKGLDGFKQGGMVLLISSKRVLPCPAVMNDVLSLSQRHPGCTYQCLYRVQLVEATLTQKSQDDLMVSPRVD